MKARTGAILALLVVAAGFGGYALHGGFGGGAAPAAGGGAANPFAGRAGGRGGNAGGFSRPGGFGGAAGASGRAATVTVQAVEVKSGPLIAERTATGTVVPVTKSNVAAQASGTVKRLLVAAGDDVKTGQPIVQLNTDALELAVANAHTQLSTAQINLQTQQTNTQQAATQLQSQLDSAQAALAAAQANYDSARKVYALGGTSKASVDSARSQLAQAQANVTSAQNALSQNQRAESESLQQLKLAITQAQNGVKQAELNLANATIRAPFDGQVASFAVAPGEYVGPSTSVATLVSGQRQVQLSVPPSDAGAFTPGTALTFSTGVAQYKVTVSQRPGAAVNQGVTVTASFDPSGDPGGASPAVGVVGTVGYRVTLATATLVPISAVQNDGTHTFLYVIQGGKAVQTELTILAQAGNQAAVSGVPAGVTVVDQPPPGLLNGAPVEVAGASGSGANRSGRAAAPRGSAPAGAAAGRAAARSGSPAGSGAGGGQHFGSGTAPTRGGSGGSAPAG
ncbi:MAG: HlyD family efflux transporter periplasmic adaptor subunit, partial [Deinococcales bacterium]